MTRTRISDLSVTAAVLGIVALVGLALSGCTNQDAPPSLYDPSVKDGPQPVISSIVPATTALANVTVITITGQNFSPVKEYNIVYFDASPGTIVSASATQLTVIPPNLVKDTVLVKVAVRGSQLFTNPPLAYRLQAAFTEIKTIGSSEEPWGTTADTLGNVYVSIAGAGIKIYAQDGTPSTWAPSGGFTKWSALKLGKNNTIYAALGLPAIFTITQGGSPQLFLSPGSGVGNVFDFDFDAQGNIWAGGDNASVYRVAPDLSVKSYAFLATVRSVRVFSGYLYVAGRTYPDSAEKVVRFQITSGGDLGSAEVYFNLTTSTFGTGGKSIYAINFSAQGDLFLGTDCTDPIIRVSTSKAASAWYPGIFAPTIHLLPWGKGNEMIGVKGTTAAGAVGSSQKVYRINMQMAGAPYFGRN